MPKKKLKQNRKTFNLEEKLKNHKPTLTKSIILNSIIFFFQAYPKTWVNNKYNNIFSQIINTNLIEIFNQPKIFPSKNPNFPKLVVMCFPVDHFSWGSRISSRA